MNSCGCETYVNPCAGPTPTPRPNPISKIFEGGCSNNFLLIVFLCVLMASNCGSGKDDSFFFVIILAVIFATNCGGFGPLLGCK